MTKSGFQVAKIEGIEVLASTGGLIDSFPGDINFENSDDRESFAREARRFGDLLVFRINKGKDRPAMIELGCHWGFYSLLFRKFFPAGVSVLADSDLGSIALAQTNFQLNNLSKIMCWGSIHPIDPNHNVFESGFKAAESCPVPILSFRDTLLPLLKSDVVDIVHMDIQGSELPLLQELEQQGVLSNRIVNLFVATHNIEEHKEVLNLLQKNSFEVLREEERVVVAYNRGGKTPCYKTKEELTLSWEYNRKKVEENPCYTNFERMESQQDQNGLFYDVYRFTEISDGAIYATNKNLK